MAEQKRTDLKPAEIQRLVRAAIDARDQAYAPYSHFYVGASLLLADGATLAGCNVENGSFSLSICAERVAAAGAIAAGHRRWRAIAIASDGGVPPCGACRQFLAEFGLDISVVLVDVINGSKQVKLLSQLLPDAFDLSSLPAHG